jgi:cellulose synthase/poly-beta-1,6-N-acetylglucosamine synthase-like glycosyltransferase
VALPALVIAAQVAIAAPRLAGFRRLLQRSGDRPATVVLVPAHNEALGIRETIKSISRELAPGDRVLVVADNCTDPTALIARESGAEVAERSDPMRQGKGYALQAGLVQLAAGQPPEIVVVVDADCRLQAGCLDVLVARVASTGRPAQACYLMTPPAAPRGVDVVSALAVLVKNRVRPLAMSRLGFPCLITGSGSAFPWNTLQAHTFEGDNLVEDMQLGVDLALAGSPASYCDDAVLFAALPDRPAAFVSQRRRWEHGHLGTLTTQVPRLGLKFLKTGRIGLDALLVDLAVPPLSLVDAINLLVAAVCVTAACLGAGWLPAGLCAAALALLSASVGLAWWRFARASMPFRVLLSVPVYVLAKLPLYASFVFRRQNAWIRTARSSQATSE